MRLEAAFQRKLRRAVLDDVEHELVERFNPVVYTAIEASHDRLRSYGDEYDVESVIESLVQPEVTRADGRVTVRWLWSHKAARFFALGTSGHTIQGNPVLSFIWEDPPADIKDQFDQARDAGGRFQSGWRVFFHSVDVSGIDETRFVRAGLQAARQELESV